MAKSEKEIVKNLLEANEGELVVMKIRERYLQRRILSNDSGKQLFVQELGNTQYNIKEMGKFVEFLKGELK